MTATRLPATRRQFLLAGLTLGVAAPNFAAETASKSLARRFVRMRGSPNDKPVMWVYEGTLLVKPEGQVAKPWVGVGGMSFTLATERTVGVYDWRLDEVGYYRDLVTGEVLDRFVNPITGAVLKPANYRSPQRLVYSGATVAVGEPLPPSTEFEGKITDLGAVGGITAMTEDLYVKVPAQLDATGQVVRPLRTLASLATFSAKSNQLYGIRRAWIDCQMSYTTMNSFAPWLGMDGVAGVQNMRLMGRKCRMFERDAIPAWLSERIERDHPQYFAEPSTWT
jgi:hypothetical protein